jgi:hypothetical protein
LNGYTGITRATAWIGSGNITCIPRLFRDLSVYVPRMNVELLETEWAHEPRGSVAVCDEQHITYEQIYPPNVIDEVRNKYPELFVESTACLAAFCRYLWRLTRWFRYKSGYGWISWRWCGEPCVWRVVIRVVLPVRLYNVQFPRPCMYFPSLIDYSTPIKIFVLFGSFLQCSLKRCGFAEDVPCFLLPPHRLVCSWSSCCSSVWDVVWWSWEISKDVV